jgi:hypothetical protein
MQEFILSHQWLVLILIIWTIPWKGVALWKSAHNGHKAWFVILLIFNTLAILEIVYIFIFSRKEESGQTQSYAVNTGGSSNNGVNMIRGL